MERKKRIEKILENNFKSSLVKVKDISLEHRGHNNFSGSDETHFLIVLQNQINKNIKSIDIHNKINKLLKNEFLSGLHALEIKIIN